MKLSVFSKNFLVLLSFSLTTLLYAQQAENSSSQIGVQQPETASVTLDGNVLFMVRGVSALPAKQRGKDISKRIENAASNYSISPDDIKAVEDNDHIKISANGLLIMEIYKPDAELEGVSQNILARVIQQKIMTSISLYRHERSRPVIINNIIRALIATAILTAVLLLLLLWLIKKLNIRIQNKIKKRIDSVDNVSFNLIKSNQIWRVFHILFDTLRLVIIIFALILFVDYVLGLFPWTNSFSKYTLKLILDPIADLGKGFIDYMPKFIFLLLIYFVTKYSLKLIKLFFLGIKEGGIIIKDFKAEWSMATYNIVRVFIAAFAIIIAYPYIPGSDSVAFKGVSVFVGVLFSLGSSSFIGNLIAGYSMLYRGAFKNGDCIEVNGQIGFVEDQKLLVTRIRSFKNVEIVIPNSVLLNSSINNYSEKASQRGLILHTIVGIGYETPWRQVDAMLKLAADRTEGILKNPPPFVLKKSLADFAVNYEINGYCNEVNNMNSIYSSLHQNILDVFNENDVQIMTPSYIADPEAPKVVPKDQWFTPLADEKG